MIGVLPDFVLDDEEYDEIFESARNAIVSMYPEWTDFNFHDPGITMLELFAMTKESQQFFLDQIGEENRRKYLKLLGMIRQKKKAAKSFVKIDADEDITLLNKNKFGAGDLCFELPEKKQLVRHDICNCISVINGQVFDFVDRGQLQFGNQLHLRPFGEKPIIGNECYIGFERELPVNTTLQLYVKTYQGYSVKRNPIQNGEFVPLVEVVYQYYSDGVWKDIKVFSDQTQGFLFDGFINFLIEEPMTLTQRMEQKAFYIRAVFQNGQYDVYPEITDISINVCEVYQKDTLIEYAYYSDAVSTIELDTQLAITGRSDVYIEKDAVFYVAQSYEKTVDEEIGTASITISDDQLQDATGVLVVNMDWGSIARINLGDATGLPFQKIDLEDLQIEHESLQILVQDVEVKEGYRLWEKVEDFGQSTAEDMHYIFHSDKGIIEFGDCIKGMAPEGKIILIGYVRTMGSDGNIKEGKINCFLLDGVSGIPIHNICDGYGGRDEESLQECFLRAKKNLKKTESAVTSKDYENYVMQTPGLMIESCKVLHIKDISQFVKRVDESMVYLVVKPYGWQPDKPVNKGYFHNIRAYLEKYRMLGSGIYICQNM